MARQPRGNAQDPARKRRLDEFDRRLTAVEGQVRTHEDRMENLEYRFELETSYRYIRIENSPGLDQMFKDLAAKTMENSEIRERTGQVLMREIREVLEREVDEGELSATSQTSNARRKWHPPYGRQHLTHLIWHLWWIYALGLGIIAATCACNKGNPHAWLSPQSRMCLIGLCIFTARHWGTNTSSRFSPIADLRYVDAKGMAKAKRVKAKMVKVKAAKARARGKAKPEETRRVRNPSNGGRIQAGCCETTKIFLSLVLSYPKGLTEDRMLTAIPSRTTHIPMSSLHAISLCRSYGTQQTGEGIPTGSPPGRMVPIGDHHRFLQYHVSLKCIGSHEFLPSRIGPAGRTGTYMDPSFTSLLLLFCFTFHTSNFEARGRSDRHVPGFCIRYLEYPRYTVHPMISLIVLFSTKTLPRTWFTVKFGQCKVDAPMALRMFTLALEKVVATYVAIIIIIKFPGYLSPSAGLKFADVPFLDLVVASLRDRLVEGTPLYPLLY